ncbi:hypothetical protein J1N35_022880, partial [Gossypium stocksii]
EKSPCLAKELDLLRPLPKIELLSKMRKQKKCCITTHDIERLVENFHELNPNEPSEPTKPETGESSNKLESKLDSVDETKEAEPEKNRTI